MTIVLIGRLGMYILWRTGVKDGIEPPNCQLVVVVIDSKIGKENYETV
ncbi:MAG: hypothetical protein PHP01_08810 [Phycisphaerae bacterium]|nr:hypothetical protein [Phycisphaerae bacterium]